MDFLITVHEVEAWMLAEHSHFLRINSTLSVDAIKRAIGIDVAVDDLREIYHPASVLNDVYALAGMSYHKGSKVTVDRIDFTEVYLNVRERFSELESLCKIVEDFLS